MLARRSLLTVLALVATACDRDPAPKAETAPQSESAPQAKSKAGPACDAAHAKALEQELAAQCALSDHVLAADVPSAAWKPAPSAPPRDALRIELRSAGVVVGWGLPVPLAELPARLPQPDAQGRPPSGWVLSIEGAAPRNDVAAVLRSLADAELPQGHLVLATEPTAPPPVPRDPKRLAQLAAHVATADPSQKAVLLAKEIESAIPSCPALEKTFSSVAAVAAAERCPLLARGVAEGLVECGCRDEDLVLTLLYSVTVGFEPPTRLGSALPVTLDPTAAPRAGTTWADVVAGLDEAALAKLWVDPV